jgi:hypothetical protein
VLYVAGLGGVYRSDGQGLFSWRYFPDVAHEGAVADGGLLPNVDVTDLKLVTGPIDPSSGLPKQQTGYNLLLAMTNGRGAFVIRLDQKLPAISFTEGPEVSSISDISNSSTEAIQVTFSRNGSPTPVDPSTFTPADVVLKDPNGNVIPVRQVLDIAPKAGNGTSQHNIYELEFAGTTAGTYTVAIGPKISDFSGNQMDQNNDGSNGDQFNDIFHGTVSITPAPRPTVSLPYSDPFAGNYGDSLARQWLETAGRFQIQTGTAANQAVALAAGTNTAILQLATAQANVTVQADVDVTSTVGAQAGVIGRYVDANDFYFGDIENNAGTYVAKIYRMFGGTLQALNSATVKVGNLNLGAGTLRLEVVNGSIKLFLNDTLQIYAYDNLVTAAGNVGIRGTQGTSFANFNATVLSLLTAPIPFNENFNVPGPGGQLDRYWIDQLGNTADVNGEAQGEAAFNLSTVNGLNLKDVSVEADIALTSGQSAGLVARYDGPFYNNFYMAQFKDIGGGQFQAALFSNIGGTFNTLAVGSTVNTGTGHLQFEVVGSSLRLLFNGVLVAFANDLNLTSGSVGVRLGGGVSLDNLTVNTITTLSATLPFSDNFSTSNPGSQLDGFWTNQLGNIRVSGGQAVGTGDFNMSTVNGINAGDVTVAVGQPSALAVGQSIGLVARYGGPGYNNFYLAQARKGDDNQIHIAIFKNVGGVFTTLAVQDGINDSPGSILTFEVLGHSLKFFYGTMGAVHAFDLDLTSGSVGMRLSQNVAADNFTAQSYGQVTTLPFTDQFSTRDQFDQLSEFWTNQLGNIIVNNLEAEGADGNFNMSTVNLASPQSDVKVQGDINPNSAGQTFGLVARYSGPLYNNFYMGQLRVDDPFGGTVTGSIFKNINGVFTAIAIGTVHPTTAPGTLEFEVAGSSLKLIYNGQLLASGFDTDLVTGSVGMRIGAAGMDNFHAEVIPFQPASLPFSDNFSTTSDGSQLDGNWRDQHGNITVVAAVPNNLATGEGDFNLSTLNNIDVANVTVAGDINLTPGAGQSAGLVARYTGPLYSNFYLAQLRDIGGGQYQAAIFKNIGGTFSTIVVGSTTTKNSGNLKFILNGSSLTLELDGMTLATAIDTSITALGSVGMRLSTGATLSNFTANSP